MSSLGRASHRYLWRHPWQLVLAILGIALGVAVVVSVDLTNESVRRAFDLSVQAVAGDATHQIVGGPAGLDETLYARLRVELGMRDSAPVIDTYGNARASTLHVVGIDPLAEIPFRGRFVKTQDAAVRTLLTTPGTVLMDASTARRLDLSVDDRFEITVGGHAHEVRLVGLLRGHDSNPAALDGLVITDIATVQAISNQPGRLIRIDLKLGDDGGDAAVLERIRNILPPGARVVDAGSRSHALLQMSRAFRTNLTAMSLLALIVGMFLIYNTMTFAVLLRRGLIASLRILGVTRGQVFRVILGETLVLGLAGSVIGLVIGFALAQGLVHLVTRTINDHYFVLTVGQLLILPWPLLKGLVLGVAATLLAALLPAAEAARTEPHAALQRSGIEARAHTLVPRLAMTGLALALGALLLLLLPSRSLLLGFAVLFLMILGLTLVTPLVVSWLTYAVLPLAGRLFGFQARLALGGVVASLSRTGAAIAALMLAVSTTVGVGVMVDSFRSTVEQWLSTTLRADLYVSAPGVSSIRPEMALDLAVLELVRGVPGVAAMSTGRQIMVESDGRLIELFALGLERSILPRYPLKAGEPEHVWPAFLANQGVLISEPLAWHQRLTIGDMIPIRTDTGTRTFPVLGIYYDYSSEQGEVLMHRSLYERHFEDPAVSAVGLYLSPDSDLQQVIQLVRRATSGTQNLLVRSNRDVRETSLAIFDRTFAVTNVLRLLAVIVAFVGILSAFMALQLERTRELGVLRATGFTPGQVTGMVTVQTGFMGLASGLLAIPTGLVLAEILIEVINRRSFGWSMKTVVSADVLLQALALALVAAILAGLYPGWRMARTPTAEALRHE